MSKFILMHVAIGLVLGQSVGEHYEIALLYRP